MKKREVLGRTKEAENNYRLLDNYLKLERNISKSRNHLDFGCGFGVFTNLLSKKFPDVKFIGLDISKNRIKTAKRHFRNKNIKYIHSNKITGRYDSITATYTLHEIKNVNSTLHQLNVSLEQKGRIMIYDFMKSRPKDFKKLYDNGRFDGSFEEEYKEHNRWTLRQFERMTKSAGFRTLQIKPNGKHFLAYIGEKK